MGRAIRHELEHIARGDWATHILARVALALYWPHPFAWALWRRLRLEAERACDDAVIRSQGQAEPYAEQLVSLARSLRGRGAVPALSMATRSTLGQRVESILDDRLRRAPRSRGTALIALAAGLACVLAIAPLRVVFAAAMVPDPPEVTSEADDDDDAGHKNAVDKHDDDDDDNSPDMALLNAAERGDLKKMQHLMDEGAKAGAVLRGDGTPLIAAARSGRVDAMEMLIQAGADVNRGVDGDGNPLTMAAKGGHLEAVQLLLDRGADIDAGVPGDGNALIMAAGAGQMEVVRFLVEKGASIEKVVPGDENPLIHASEGGQAEVVRFLLGKGADVNARVWAAGGGPNGRRGEWRTALLMARRNGHDDVARILLAAGARE
jgi:ankyrin repeat protein